MINFIKNTKFHREDWMIVVIKLSGLWWYWFPNDDRTFVCFLFRLPRTYLFMSNSMGVSRSRGRLPYRCTWSMPVFSGVRIAHLFFYFVCIILVTYCSLLCFFSVFYVWSLSLDYFLLVSARTLVPWLFSRVWSLSLDYIFCFWFPLESWFPW